MALCKMQILNYQRTRKEMMYIQMLEGLHADESDLLISIKRRI